MMRSRFSSDFLVALLLVSAVIPAGPVGSAAAVEAGECSDLDDFVMFLTLGAVNSDSCTRQAYVEATIEDMEATEKNQTEVDIYNGGVGLKSGQEAWAAPFDNYLNDTESVAWMKAEKAIAQAYQNGSTKSQAKVAAREALAEYYSVKAVNLIEQQNQTVHQLHVLNQEKEQTSIQDDFLYAPDEKPNDGNDISGKIYGTTTQTVTLPNGTTHGVLALDMQGIGYETYHGTLSIANPMTEAGNSGNMRWSQIIVRPPNSNYQEKSLVDFRDYGDRLTRIKNQNTQLQNEANTYVNGTYGDYESGKVNASDVISSHTAMFEYGVRGANESEGLWRSTAALAMMGYDTPDLNASGTMEMTYQNVNYNGLIMAENAPNGTWSANTTYNTSNIDGPVFFLSTEGEKIDIPEGAEFRIGSMKAKDGTAINSTQTTKYVYKTSNTTELLEMQQQLLELRQEIEDREPTAGGGGTAGGLNLSESQKLLIGGGVGLVALLGAAVLFKE